METGPLELGAFVWTDRLARPVRTENCAHLFWIRSGSGNITSGGQHSKAFRPYSLVCVGGPGIGLQVANQISGYSLEVTFDYMASSFQGMVFPMLEEFLRQLRQPVLLIHFSQRARCEADWLLQHMLREDRKCPEYFWTSIRLTLGQFLLLCFQQWLLNEQAKESVSAVAETVVKLLCDYIDEHLNEDFGLKQLSQRAGYAPSYLSSLFSKVNGQGLTEYVSRKRIACAQYLLRSGNLKIVEICYRVGFRDLAHFNRSFKRFVGVTPNEYRQLAERDVLPVDDVPAYLRSNWSGKIRQFRTARLSA